MYKTNKILSVTGDENSDIPSGIWAIRILRRWAIALTSSRGKLWEGVARSAKCTITVHTAGCTATHYCQEMLYLLLWSICCCLLLQKYFFLDGATSDMFKSCYQVSLVANNVGYFVESSSIILYLQYSIQELKILLTGRQILKCKYKYYKRFFCMFLL